MNRRTRVGSLLVLVCLLSMTGCDRIQRVLRLKKTTPPPSAPLTELEIVGTSEVEQSTLQDLLKVKGVMKYGTGYSVVINTQLVRKGQALRADFEGQPFYLEIRSVEQGRVVLESIDPVIGRERWPRPKVLSLYTNGLSGSREPGGTPAR